MNINSLLMKELRSKPYRDAYIAGQIEMNLPFQIRALRKERDLSQGDLAGLAQMAQPRVSEIEKPGARNLNLETLKRIASGLDVGLEVRFVSFSELVDWAEHFNPEHFHVPSFGEELAALKQSRRDETSLEEEGPAGDNSREAGPEIFDPGIIPCVALPDTQPAGTAQLSR